MLFVSNLSRKSLQYSLTATLSKFVNVNDAHPYKYFESLHSKQCVVAKMTDRFSRFLAETFVLLRYGEADEKARPDAYDCHIHGPLQRLRGDALERQWSAERP